VELQSVGLNAEKKRSASSLRGGYWVDWSKVSRHKLYDASGASFMRGENTLFEELPKKAIELIG